MLIAVKQLVGRFLPQGGFGRSVGILIGGTASGQALLMLATPILTRLYSPEDFGLMAVYSGLVGLLVVGVAGRYEWAIPLPQSDQEAADIVKLCLLAVLVSTQIVGSAALVFGDFFALAMDVPRLRDYWWLLPIGVFLGGVYAIFRFWAVRVRDFSAIARTQVLQATASLAVQLLSFKAGGVALLFGHTGSQAVGSLGLARKALVRSELWRWDWVAIRDMARRYRQFPLWSTWGSLMDNAGVLVPPMLFAALYSPGTAGHYILAHRVLTAPVSLLAQATGDVFHSRAAAAWREGHLDKIVLGIVRKMVMIGAVPTIVLLLAGPSLFEVAFGAGWKQAGEIVRMILPWIFLTSMAGPLSRIFPIVNRNREGTLFNLVLTMSRIGSVLVGYYILDGGFGVTVALFGGVCALGSFLFLARCINLAGVSLEGVAVGLLRHSGWLLLMSLPVVVGVLSGEPFGAILGAAVCLALHAGYLANRLRRLGTNPSPTGGNVPPE